MEDSSQPPWDHGKLDEGGSDQQASVLILQDGAYESVYSFGISLESEAFKKLLHTDTYNDLSLHCIGYQKIDGRWIRRGSGWEVKPDSKDKLRAIEHGPSKPAPKDDTEVRPSKLVLDDDAKPTTPPPAPTHIETPTQPTPWTLRAPPLRARIDDNIEERVSFIVDMVIEDIHILSILVDRMQTKIHLLRTYTDDALGQLRENGDRIY